MGAQIVTVYARRCIIEEVDEEQCTGFLNSYHLQGSCEGQIVRLGLFYRDDLVGLMTFGYPRYNKNAAWELLRLCYKSGIRVTGGSAKLFNYFIKLKNPDNVISYCNLDLFTGDVYKSLGFEKLGTSYSSTKWVKDNRWISDSELRKYGADKLIGTADGKGSSNEQIMKREGWRREHYQTVQAYLWDSTICGSIYKITNLIDGKIYIGKTKWAPDIRWQDHCRGNVTRIDKVIAKTGKEHFHFEVIDTADTFYELNQKESSYISTLKPEYNDRPGGYGAYVAPHTEETKAKISAASTQLWQNPCYRDKVISAVKEGLSKPETKAKISENSKNMWENAEIRARISVACSLRKHTPETKAKISAANKGYVATEETRNKISIARKGFTHTEETKAKIGDSSRGRYHTKETCAKISAAKRGKPLSEEAKANMRGVKHRTPMSEEQKAKLSAALKGRKKVVDQDGKITFVEPTD